MTIDALRALAARFPPASFAWTEDDVIRYHLALGAGAPHCTGAELRYVDEQRLHVLATFVVQVASAASTLALQSPGLDHDPLRVVHVGQEVTLYAPLPPSGNARNRARIRAIHDKGTAALVDVEVDTVLVSGAALARSVFRLLLPGEGGFGGDRGPSARGSRPTRAPDGVHAVATLPQQAALFRMSGDRTRLHIDPDIARALGHPQPTLQGLCTWGIVTKALVDHELGGDAGRVLGVSTAFTGPVYPGETLLIEVWRGEDEHRAEVRVAERDSPALGSVVVRFSA
jgi:acyl dehydratase